MRSWSSVVRVGAVLFAAGAMGGGLAVAAEEVVLLDTNNPAAVEVRAAQSVTFRLERPHVITRILTYHWNGGRGALPAQMILDDPQAHVQYGPWQAVGTVPKANGAALYWTCHPNLRLAAGDYVLRAVDPASWSQNAASGHRGMCVIHGVPMGGASDAAPETPGNTTPEPTPPAAAGFSTGPLLAAVDLTPTIAGRPIPAGDGLSITLPASVVGRGGRLEVAAARFDGVAVSGTFDHFGLYNVSIADRHEFEDDIVLECRYDAARLDPDVAPEDQILAARWDPTRRLWVELPSTVDPLRGVIVTRTRHLSLNAWIYNAKIVACELIRHLTETVIRTEHFRFYYESTELKQNKWIASWRGEQVFPPEYEALWTYKNPAWIPFVRDLAYYLERSYAEYDKAELTPLATVPIRVDLGPGRAGKDGKDLAQYEHQSHSMLVSSDKVRSSPSALQHVLAHELFHSIQNKDWQGDATKVMAPATLWWIEATAEYAACRVAWQLDSMGGGRPNVYPFLLERPLTESGVPACPHNTPDPGFIEYDRGYFLDYLVRRGVAFKPLYKATMQTQRQTGRLLPALEGYLATNGPQPLPSLFREYAAWFLFDVEGPRGKDADPLDAAVNPGHAAVIPGEETPPVLRQAFTLPAPYTAATWAVKAVPYGDEGNRVLEIRAPGLDVWGVVDIYRLPDGKREAFPYRVAALTDAATKERVELGPNETLFVTAINLHASRTTNLAVEIEVRPETPPKPETAGPPPGAASPATGRWVLTGTKKLDGGHLDLGKVQIDCDASPGKAQVAYTGDLAKGADFSQGLLSATWTPASPPVELRPDQVVEYKTHVQASGGSPGKGNVEIFPEGYLEGSCPSGWGTNLCLLRTTAGTAPSGAWRTSNQGTATLRMGQGKPGQVRTLTIYLNAPRVGVGFEYTYAWQAR